MPLFFLSSPWPWMNLRSLEALFVQGYVLPPLLPLLCVGPGLSSDSSDLRRAWIASCFGRQPEWAHPWQRAQLLIRRSAVLFWTSAPGLEPMQPARADWCDDGRRLVSVTVLPEAPAGTVHWQPAAPSAPVKQHDLRPPLFPTERPSLFWTHASTERQGTRPGQLSGVVLHSVFVWIYVWCVLSHND